MAPMFASPDIAALVAAFPPPLPTKDRPSLVKSLSGNNFQDSRKVLAEFRALLETGPGRVRKTELPSRLDLEKADWLLDCYDGQIYYSKDLQSLFSTKEAQDIAGRISDQAREDFVDVAGFLSEQDISNQSCEQLLDAAPNLNLRHFSLSDGRHIIAENTFVDRMKDTLFSAMKDARGERVDLTSSERPSLPLEINLRLAEEVVQQHGHHDALLEQEGGKIIYVPADYHDLQKKKQEQTRQSAIEAAVNDLSSQGYCDSLNDSEGLVTDVMSRYREQHSDIELVSFDQSAKGAKSLSTIVAKKLQVSTVMIELDGVIANTVRADRQADASSASLNALETSLCDETSHLGLTKRLLNSTAHRQILEASVASAVKAVQDTKDERFAFICRDSFLAPLELHSQGLRTVPEKTLNDRLSQYIGEHFRLEVVPALVQAIQTETLNDKARTRDMDKLSAVSAQAKTLADVQFAASKLCRKQKIEPPNDDELSSTKQAILRQKLRLMKRMSRGSDVLQNLLWILLAQNSNGLFLSSGKDTSRMIKHYQSVGDAEKGRRLGEWRDALKAGRQSDEDVHEMKTMAEEVIETMYGIANNGHPEG